MSLPLAMVPVIVPGTLRPGWVPGRQIWGTVHGAEENCQVTNPLSEVDVEKCRDLLQGSQEWIFHSQISASTFYSDISLAPLQMT